MKDNLYNRADDSSEAKAFNSLPTFTGSSHEVTREERERAEDKITQLSADMKAKIAKGN